MRPRFISEESAPCLHITGGRHPVLDALMEGTVVPNDAEMSHDGSRAVIITGPNMVRTLTDCLCCWAVSASPCRAMVCWPSAPSCHAMLPSAYLSCHEAWQAARLNESHLLQGGKSCYLRMVALTAIMAQVQSAIQTVGPASTFM